MLTPPLDCDLGAACYIQRYVDLDPGPGVADYMCGTLSGDGHKGTDMALPSRAVMEDGVNVIAAAPGTVRNVRDGMADIPLSDPASPVIDGRDCGNGVAITHGDGWETQYCHLKRNSVAVSPGDQVTRATVLGEVGLSGATTYPHLHFSVRVNGAVVDPFDPDARGSCVSPPDRSLWAEPPDYAPGGLVSVGLLDRVPDYDEIKAGTAAADELDVDAPALVVWGYAFGVESGDVLALSLEGPMGEIVADDVTLNADQPLAFRAIGRRAPAGAWPEGSYRGRVIHSRDGETLDVETVSLRLSTP